MISGHDQDLANVHALVTARGVVPGTGRSVVAREAGNGDSFEYFFSKPFLALAIGGVHIVEIVIVAVHGIGDALQNAVAVLQ